MFRRFAPFLLLAASAAAATLWAFAPLDRPALEVPTFTETLPQENLEQERLDLIAFRAPLWIAPSPPPPPPPQPRPEPPPPPPPPLKFHLLAIVREADALKAVLYDPDTDRLLVVAEGEPLGSRRIERVHPSAVDIRDDRGVRTLSLADAPPGGAR
jgi:hypothetical protein